MPLSTAIERRSEVKTAYRDADGSSCIRNVQPVRPIDLPAQQALSECYDKVAEQRDQLRHRNWYYYDLLIHYLRFFIPPGQCVLEIGCGDGHVLRRLQPAAGLGIDFSAKMIEKARSEAEPNEPIRFEQANIATAEFRDQFDYVLMSDLLGDILDIQQALDNVRSACHAKTRIVITYHSLLWEPLFQKAQLLRAKTPQLGCDWLSRADIENFADLCDFELLRYDRRILLPKYVPLLSPLLNRFFAPLPILNAMCMVNITVLKIRPRRVARPFSTSLIIPCRNERGNIRSAIERMPEFGKSQEIIFVDGHSTDGTVDEIKRVMADYPHKDIQLYVQEGQGKGDAVRLGFSKASKDILIILDADLTVPPDDLPKFFQALASGHGDFINGSRLVYPMEGQAMRPLNVMGNKFFSLALTWLVNQRLKDTLCGTKALFRTDYERIAAGRAYFGDFDPFGDFDLLFGAAKLNLKIVEVPIRYRDRSYGFTNISRFRHGLLLLRMTWFAFCRLKLI
jgi:SAM-dependent methyltransferase